MIKHSSCHHREKAYTLLELMASMAVLSLLLVMFSQMTSGIHASWSEVEKRTKSIQNGRAALQLIGREISQSIVDTRMQFVVMNGSVLTQFGATNIAPNTPAVFGMAPIGPNGELRMIGYYLYRDDTRQHYRLKRVYVSPSQEYFPKVTTDGKLGYDLSSLPRPCDADWILGHLNKTAFSDTNPAAINSGKVVTSTAIDGVIGFWIQCYDQSGNPIPWLSQSIHPENSLPLPHGGRIFIGDDKASIIYNSAGYFSELTSSIPGQSDTFSYSSGSDVHRFRGNRIPAAVEITVVMIDEQSLATVNSVPNQQNVMNGSTLSINGSLHNFNQSLEGNAQLSKARRLTKRINMANGGSN